MCACVFVDACMRVCVKGGRTDLLDSIDFSSVQVETFVSQTSPHLETIRAEAVIRTY